MQNKLRRTGTEWKLSLRLVEGTQKKEQSTIFQFRPQLNTPVIDDDDNDIDGHMMVFENYLAMIAPNGGIIAADRLKVFGNTLKGLLRPGVL